MNRAPPARQCRPARQLCVLGMHRSGTSSLAGSLEQAGVLLGDVNNQAPYNKKGNKENLTLRHLNEDLLSLNHGGWDLIPARLDWNSDLCARRDALIAEYESSPLWGFKDPRCLVTLPFWREALPGLCFVGTFRHPAAVVRSLIRRPGLLPKTPPLQLWIDYNQRLLDLCRAERVPLVCFDWPEATYLTALDMVKDELGLPVTNTSSPFFEAGLVSAAPNIGTPEEAIGPADLQDEATRLYAELQALAIEVPADRQSDVYASDVSDLRQ